MRALLDVNMLIALLDAEHVHHELARRWLRQNIQSGWATCPITQNGCVRIMAQPKYSNQLPAALVAERLQDATRTDQHEFWADDISLIDTAFVDWSQLIGPRQITDVYLLALAVAHHGRFVTFDARIPVSAVSNASDHHLLVI